MDAALCKPSTSDGRGAGTQVRIENPNKRKIYTSDNNTTQPIKHPKIELNRLIIYKRIVLCVYFYNNTLKLRSHQLKQPYSGLICIARYRQILQSDSFSYSLSFIYN